MHANFHRESLKLKLLLGYFVGKAAYISGGNVVGSPSVQSQKMGTVVVVSDKEGGKPTSGYLPTDPLLISDSSSPLPPVASTQYQQHHPRSNSQSGCFQDDGYCIAVTKNAEGKDE